MNTIDSTLQLTEVLDAAIDEFRRTILPLTSFSTVFENVALKGDDTVTVPFYPRDTTRSRRRTSKQDYRDKVGHTLTQSRQIRPTLNMIQGLSFTQEEAARQPRLNPEKHGRNKGRALAHDVIADIFLQVAAGIYTGATIGATPAANFDENDVADLAQICDEDFWPDANRSLILKPSFYYNLVKQPAILDLSQSGSMETLRKAMVPDLFKFGVMGTAGMKTNNLPGLVFAANATTDELTITLSGSYDDEVLNDYLVDGAAVEVTEVGTLPTGLAASTRYYVRDLDVTARTCKLAATPGGAAINITAAGSGANTIARKEDLAGVAVYDSAILTAFAPVPPTEGQRKKLIDYQVVGADAGPGMPVLEFRHMADEFTGQEYQILEVHYGFAPGDHAALKRIEDSAL